ncbi:hypothetical protein CTZ27_37130 [Streptomyces griseocarneus]|nr:hypothetical protein CTZ27_37130 [Streptomyces griseocarneus]
MSHRLTPADARVRAALLTAVDEAHLPLTVEQVTALALVATQAALGRTRRLPTEPLVSLTGRQLAVVLAIANDEVADLPCKTGLSPNTFRTHRHLAYQRLGVRTGAAAVAVSMATELIQPSQIVLPTRLMPGGAR